MPKKDFFSGHSKLYATFRPTYPEELYQFIFQHVKDFSCAWDCATGNGQAAQYLCKRFKKIYATDISAQQLEHAYQADNIVYSVTPAEKTSFTDNKFDLITVGQALHWFNADEFYREVKRVGKPGSVIAVWGYSILSIASEIDPLINHYYKNTVGPYWDTARTLVDDEYRSISFPFEEISAPKFYIKVEWNLQTLAGYLESWSATQKFIKENNGNPVIDLIKELRTCWPETELRMVTFPVFMRLGRISE